MARNSWNHSYSRPFSILPQSCLGSVCYAAIFNSSLIKKTLKLPLLLYCQAGPLRSAKDVSKPCSEPGASKKATITSVLECTDLRSTYSNCNKNSPTPRSARVLDWGLSLLTALVLQVQKPSWASCFTSIAWEVPASQFQKI